MKVLILSCNTGGGHNSAAEAIRESFANGGYECDIFDSLKLFSKGISKAISSGHVFVYRHLPRLFGATYRFEEKHNNKILYYTNAGTADDLYEYITEKGYDTVICVHVFSALTVTEMRRRYPINIRAYFVATDYTCSPGVNMGDMDRYFIPVGLKNEFKKCGLSEVRLCESGIPIREVFYSKTPAEKAKEVEGIDVSKKHILVMCGSMGAGPMEELTASLAKYMPDNVCATVVCGNNKRLREQLLPYESESIRIKGFCNNVSELMDASDLMIGKPGGLSTTEAMAKRLPLVCINAVPGCETRNLEFLLRGGYALAEKDAEGLASLAIMLALDDRRLAMMRELIERDFDYKASERISAVVLGDNKI